MEAQPDDVDANIGQLNLQSTPMVSSPSQVPLTVPVHELPFQFMNDARQVLPTTRSFSPERLPPSGPPSFWESDPWKNWSSWPCTPCPSWAPWWMAARLSAQARPSTTPTAPNFRWPTNTWIRLRPWKVSSSVSMSRPLALSWPSSIGPSRRRRGPSARSWPSTLLDSRIRPPLPPRRRQNNVRTTNVRNLPFIQLDRK